MIGPPDRPPAGRTSPEPTTPVPETPATERLASLFTRLRHAVSDEVDEVGGLAAPEPPIAEASSLSREGRAFAAEQSPLAALHSAPADRLHTGKVPAPLPPRSLSETGLTLGQLADLLLKLTYLHGSLTGAELASHVRLPFRVVEEVLFFLRRVRCLQVQGGTPAAEFAYRYQLTEEGRVRAREAFEQCRYVGPAPVSLRSYVEQCRRQTVRGVPCTFERLRPAFDDLVLRPGLLEEIGPAITDGQAIFLYGPSGNGKTALARRIGRYLHTSAGEVYVPYAVLVDGLTITVFDPNVHQTVDDHELESTAVPGGLPSGPSLANPGTDLRWRRIRRPVVVTAGELTLEMLDLRFHPESRYYVAPLHVKSNGGVFVIDDFGRQRVSPRDLLNRWILPLAERRDYLTLATGKKFAVPFEQLIVFSTNLEPRDLVDDAFLRRIRYKLAVLPPTLEEYTEVFERGCRERGLLSDPDCIRYLFSERYNSSRPPRWSDPQDLLQIVCSICRFRGMAPSLSRELMVQAAGRFFGDIGEPAPRGAAGEPASRGS